MFFQNAYAVLFLHGCFFALLLGKERWLKWNTPNNLWNISNMRLMRSVRLSCDINDPNDILKENGRKSGSGEPIISINYAEKISIYSKE